MDLGCRELRWDGNQALRRAEIWLGKTPKLWACKTFPPALLPPVLLLDERGQVSPILVPQFPLSGVLMVIPFPAAPKACVSCGCKGAPRRGVWPLASGEGGGTGRRGLCSAFSAQTFTVALVFGSMGVPGAS